MPKHPAMNPLNALASGRLCRKEMTKQPTKVLAIFRAARGTGRSSPQISTVFRHWKYQLRAGYLLAADLRWFTRIAGHCITVQFLSAIRKVRSFSSHMWTKKGRYPPASRKAETRSTWAHPVKDAQGDMAASSRRPSCPASV